MTTTILRTFHVVRPAMRIGEKDELLEFDAMAVEGTDDVAKKNAAAHLVAQGWRVRSLNWSPVNGGGLCLVAYVVKKES